jgi:hypothetical protein
MIINGLTESLTIDTADVGAFGVPLTVTGITGGFSASTIHLTPHLLRALARMALEAAETVEAKLGMKPGELM